jgi:hypothetical protein
MMEAVRTNKTSVYYNETTRRNIPDALIFKPKYGFEALNIRMFLAYAVGC